MKIRLQAVREQRLMTQRELAARSGVSAVTINRIEAQHHEARISTVRKLAEALNAEPDELVDTEHYRSEWAARRARPAPEEQP